MDTNNTDSMQVDENDDRKQEETTPENQISTPQTFINNVSSSHKQTQPQYENNDLEMQDKQTSKNTSQTNLPKTFSLTNNNTNNNISSQQKQSPQSLLTINNTENNQNNNINEKKDENNNISKKKHRIIIKLETENKNENELPINNLFSMVYNIGSEDNITGDEISIRKQYKIEITNGIWDIRPDLAQTIQDEKWSLEKTINVIVGNNYKGIQCCIAAPTTDLQSNDNNNNNNNTNNELNKNTSSRINWLYYNGDGLEIIKMKWRYDKKLQRNIPKFKLKTPELKYGALQSKYIVDHLAQHILNYKGMFTVENNDLGM